MQETEHFFITQFIISGGYISHLIGQVTEYNDIDIYIESDNINAFKKIVKNIKSSDGIAAWKKNRMFDYEVDYKEYLQVN